MITEDYCSYEVAKLLKEKGFPFMANVGALWINEQGSTKLSASFAPITWDKDGYTPCISLDLAMKRLREKGIIISLSPTMNVLNAHNGYLVSIDRIVSGELKYEQEFGLDTYEEAVEAALKYSLENLI